MQTGDILYAGTITDSDKLNGITNEINNKSTIHIYTYEDATEETGTSNSYSDTSKTFNLNAPIGSYITKITIKADLKTSSDATNNFAMLTLKINGINLGTKYLNRTFNVFFTGTYGSEYDFIMFLDTEPDTSPIPSPICSRVATYYNTYGCIVSENLKLLDESTTFTLRMAGNNTTPYVKNVVIQVVYATSVIED